MKIVILLSLLISISVTAQDKEQRDLHGVCKSERVLYETTVKDINKTTVLPSLESKNCSDKAKDHDKEATKITTF